MISYNESRSLLVGVKNKTDKKFTNQQSNFFIFMLFERERQFKYNSSILRVVGLRFEIRNETPN